MTCTSFTYTWFVQKYKQYTGCPEITFKCFVSKNNTLNLYKNSAVFFPEVHCSLSKWWPDNSLLLIIAATNPDMKLNFKTPEAAAWSQCSEKTNSLWGRAIRGGGVNLGSSSHICCLGFLIFLAHKPIPLSFWRKKIVFTDR